MKNLLLMIVSLVILISCNCTETNLTKEEKKWFSIYEKGQNLIFKSDRGSLDTIIVLEKVETHNNKNCNYFGIGSMQPNVMIITLKSNACRNEPYCNGEIFISKDKVDRNYVPSFSLYGLNQINELEKDTSKLKSIKLNSKDRIYKQVYIFTDGLNAKSYGNNYLKSFYWDKNEGLIRYDTNEGEVFELFTKN